MSIEWSAELFGTGNDEIDEQHKVLFERTNELGNIVKRGSPRPEVNAVLSFLQSYVIDHFACEETCMKYCHCPVAEVNEKQHGEFLHEFLRIKENIEYANDLNLHIHVVELYSMIGTWLIRHISKVDTNLKVILG